MRIDKGLVLLRFVHDDDGGGKKKSLATNERDPEAWKVGVLTLSPGRKEPWPALATGCRLQQFKMAFRQFCHPL
jgi:hypothetical protein